MEKTILGTTPQPRRQFEEQIDPIEQQHHEMGDIFDSLDSLTEPQARTLTRNKFVTATLLGVAAAGAIGINAAPAAAYQSNHDGSVTIEKGDNLSTVVEHETGLHGAKLYEKVKEVANTNHIRNPNLIRPGQKIEVSEAPSSNASYTLKYGDTIWGSVKDHYGHVSPDLVRDVSQASGLDQNHYLAGSVLKFPAEKTSEAERATWTIHDQNQTIWALSHLVAAINGTNQNVELNNILAANPGMQPRLLQMGDKVTLPGVTDSQVVKLVDGIAHLKNIESPPTVQATVKQETPNASLETVAASQPADPKTLAKNLLQSPNVTIQSSPGDRVKQSLIETSVNGKTFTHDISNKNNEVPVSTRLLQTLAGLAKDKKIEISSLTTGDHVANSDHYRGEAVDLAINADSTAVFTELYDNRSQLGIDELISSSPPANTTNLKNGQSYDYDSETLGEHSSHIHASFNSIDPLPTTTEAQTPATPETKPTAELTPEQLAQIDSFNLRDDQKQFLKDTIVAAKQIALTHHINPAVMIAQAIIESNWGNNVTGDFNYFGIKGGDPAAGTGKISHTFEYGSNGRYETDAVFRNYQSPAEAFTDYANLIETHPWFADAAENYKDWQTYLNDLQNGPPSYATAPNYVEVISGVVGDLHLAELATIGGN